MTEDLTPEQELELISEPIGEGKVLFDKCHFTVKDKHIVAECESIEASKELALLLSEDVFIRIKPSKAEIEELKKPEPVTEQTES